MFGFIIGTLCLFALVGTLRRHRYRHWMFAHGPYGMGGGPFFRGPGYGYGHGPGDGRPRRWGGHGHGIGRALFAELDTTPGQEKAIADTVNVLREHMAGTRAELRAARKDVAAAIGGEVLDNAALEAALARGQGVAQTFARELSHALAEVHAALDSEQRKQLAELIADGAPWRGLGRGRW